MADDKEMFEEAFAGDEPEAEVQEAPQAEETEQAEQAEQAAEASEDTSEDAGEQEEQPEQEAEQPEEKKGRNVRIPLSEHLAEREKRQEAERRLQEFEREKEDTNRRLQEMERRLQEASQPKEPEQTVDPYADLDGYVNQKVGTIEQRMQQQALDFSFRLAQTKHGETFDEAFSALEEQGRTGNRQLVQSIVGSHDPGEAVVEWYRREKAIKEVGTDPEAYKQKLREEMMADPEVRKQILEAVKSEASGGQSDQPRNTTQLPPSLNSATSAASNASEQSRPQSDAELFREAFGG